MNLGTLPVGLLNCVHGPNESGHISCGPLNCVHEPNEYGHISSWATQLCSWTQWIWTHFLLGYSSKCMDPMNLGTFLVLLINCVHGPNESGHIFLLGYSTVLMDPMNLGTFSVRLLNCMHGSNESGQIFCWVTQLYAWSQWIWAHFLLGYSTVCMDPMNLGTFSVRQLNCMHGPNESGHIFC